MLTRDENWSDRFVATPSPASIAGAGGWRGMRTIAELKLDMDGTMVRRGLPNLLALAALICAWAFVVPRAHAERYVFEAYDGARPREAAVVMPLVRRELSKTDFQADPAILAKKFADHQFRPGIADAAYTAERFDNDVAAGMAAWSDANFAKAAERLERALTLVRENPMLLVREIKTRNLVMRALLRLALTSRRYADTLARQPARNAKAQAKIDTALRVAQARHTTAMTELIRTFGKTAITAETFGAEAAEQFRDAVGALQNQGTGQMLVTASDATLTLYLNEQFEPNLLGHVRANLAPGVYRILVQARDRETREYSITVVANTLAQLDIQMTADNLFTTDTWVGFHDVGTGTTSEGELAAAILKLQPTQTEVIVMTVVPRVSNIAVYATKYHVPTGRLICRGLVELDRVVASKTSSDRLGQLVAFLRGSNEAPLQAVTIEKDTRANPAATPPTGQPPKRQIAVTPTVVDRPVVTPVIVPTVVTVPPRVTKPIVDAPKKIDGTTGRVPAVRPAAPPLPASDVDEPTVVDTGRAETVVAPAPRGGRLAGKILVGGGVVAILVGAGLFAIDEDPTGGGQAVANPTYRDSAVPGVIAMSAGAVSLGVGIWLWARSGARPAPSSGSNAAAVLHPRAAPLVTATNSQVVLGWTGTF